MIDLPDTVLLYTHYIALRYNYLDGGAVILTTKPDAGTTFRAIRFSSIPLPGSKGPAWEGGSITARLSRRYRRAHVDTPASSP